MKKNMNSEVKKNMEIMKKVIEERNAKNAIQKNTKRPSTYGTQSPGAGNIK